MSNQNLTERPHNSLRPMHRLKRRSRSVKWLRNFRNRGSRF